MDISVNEIEVKNFDLIADYWLKSDDDFLEGMGVDLEKVPKRKNHKWKW